MQVFLKMALNFFWTLRVNVQLTAWTLFWTTLAIAALYWALYKLNFICSSKLLDSLTWLINSGQTGRILFLVANFGTKPLTYGLSIFFAPGGKTWNSTGPLLLD